MDVEIGQYESPMWTIGKNTKVNINWFLILLLSSLNGKCEDLGSFLLVIWKPLGGGGGVFR